MVTLQKESWRAGREGGDAMLRLHWEEVANNKDSIPLAPDWDRYEQLEREGHLIVYTARAGGQLAGYAAFFLNYHIHYNTTLIAQNDLLFLHPEHRKGTAGIKLIKFAIAELEKLRVDKISWHIKYDHDFSPILKRLGFVHDEFIMSKVTTRRELWA